jgi:hypothetical protein
MAPPKARKKTFNENLVDFLTTVGLFALASGAGYWHAWKTAALILLASAYFQRLRRRWDTDGVPSLWERLYAFYKEVRSDLDARREAERKERQERLGIGAGYGAEG